MLAQRLTAFEVRENLTTKSHLPPALRLRHLSESVILCLYSQPVQGELFLAIFQSLDALGNPSPINSGQCSCSKLEFVLL